MSASALEQVAAAIRAGGVAVIPTDTVYGLACDPRDASAVERIYDIKRRPAGLELNVLAAALDDVEPLVELSPLARTLAARFWPGGLSLVCPVGVTRLAIPRSGATLMVRVPGHPLVRELLSLTGPVASTSANRHGDPAADDAAGAGEALGDEVDAVLDGGPGAGMASTIIDLTTTPPRVLREGLIPADELRPFLGG